jgi:hypothetical protein
MRTKQVQGATVTDLGNLVPFLPNNTVVVINTGTSADTIQFGTSSTGPFSTGQQPDGTAATIAAGGSIEVVISGRYAVIENGAGSLVILGN